MVPGLPPLHIEAEVELDIPPPLKGAVTETYLVAITEEPLIDAVARTHREPEDVHLTETEFILCEVITPPETE